VKSKLEGFVKGGPQSVKSSLTSVGLETIDVFVLLDIVYRYIRQ